MKLSVLLFLQGILSVQANEIFSQNSLNIQLEKASLEEILEEIQQQTEYGFIYDYEYVKEYDAIDIHFNNASMDAVLYELLKDTGLDYRLEEKMIVLFSRENLRPKVKVEIETKSEQEKIKVKGKVTDEQGVPLPGVSVVIRGTNTGVATNIDGEYLLSIAEEDMLVFSFVGMTPQEVKYEGQANLNVVLLEDKETLGEVVVTGYQTIAKERVTGSFGKIGNEIVEEVIADNFVTKLEGQVAGVQVGADNSIRIRGASTIFGDADPLIIVDNFPIEGDLKTINPDDVESITILKDASAASIWGARAANGVVVITTKKGGKSDDIKITASHFITIEEKPDFSDLDLLSSAQMIDLEEEYIEKGWFSLFSTQIFNRSMSLLEEAYSYKSEGYNQFDVEYSEEDYNSRVNQLKNRDAYSQFEKYLLRNSVKNRSFLSLQGSGERNNFYLSASYQNDLLKEKGNESDRFNIQFNNDYSITPNLTLTSNINVNINKAKNNGVSLRTMLDERPYNVLYDESDQLAEYYQIDPWVAEEVEEVGYFPYKTSLLHVKNRQDNVKNNLTTRLQVGLEYKILDGLAVSSQYQYERGYSKSESLTFRNNPSLTQLINNFTSEDDNGSLEYRVPKGDKYSVADSEFTSWTWRNQVTFDKTIDNLHQFNFLAGTEIRSYFRKASSNSYHGYDRNAKSAVPFNQKDAANVFDFAPWTGPFMMFDFNSFSESEDKFFSVYSNLSYTYNEKYSLTASARIDKSSSFGSDIKNAPLWSAGLSWNIGKEDFMKLDNINRLIVRATYGKAGNIDKQYPPFDLGILEQGIFTSHPYIWIDNPANPELKWETTTTTNLGVDVSAFNHKLQCSLDLYAKNSKDIVGEVALEGASGFSSAYKNFADMTNKGIEISLSGEVYKNKNLSVKSGINFSYNKNEVAKIYSAGANTREYLFAVNNGTSANGAPVIGKPVDRIYAYNYAGLNNEGEPMLVNAEGEKVLWSEFNDSFESLKYMGTGVAPYHGGLWTSVVYKGLSLKLNFVYQAGGVMRMPAPMYKLLTPSFYFGSRGNAMANLDRRWRNPGDEEFTKIPGISPLGNSHMNGYSRYYEKADMFVESSDFLKLRDITLEYRIPKSIVDKTPFKQVSFKLQAKNMWMWTNNSANIDPESVISDPYFLDKTYRFPMPKSITLGAKLNF